MKPSPEEIALVLRTACQIVGERYDLAKTGQGHFKARTYAFLILAHKYRKLRHEDVMVLLSVEEKRADGCARHALERARLARGETWFDFKKLNQVLTAIGWPHMTRDEACVRRAPAQRQVSKIRAAPEPIRDDPPVEDLSPRISLAPVRLDTRVSDAPPTAAEIAAIESMYAA